MNIDIITKNKENNIVYVNDFGDNYHRSDNEPSSELELAARKIRRRYRFISDYLTAKAIYESYMELMYDKYGGRELFKIKARSGLIEDFIPPKPRMKNNRTNKEIMKKKIIISNVKSRDIDVDVINRYLEQFDDGGENDIDSFITNTDKKAVKLYYQGKTNSYSLKDYSKIDSIDFLEEYFLNKNKMKAKKEKQKRRYHNYPSLTEILSDDYVPRVKNTEDEEDVIMYQGQFLTRSAVEELEIYRQLGELGWDPIKLMKRGGVSKKMTKAMKKHSKVKRKKKKKSKIQKKTDNFVMQLLNDNHESYEEYEREMLNFTADNILNL